MVATPRQEMEQGARAADAWWDANRMRLTMPFLCGFLTKLMTLITASSSPTDALKVFDSCRIGVETLEIMKNKSEH